MPPAPSHTPAFLQMPASRGCIFSWLCASFVINQNCHYRTLYDGLSYFPGYMSKRDFKAQAVGIPRFYKNCRQYPETKTVNQSVPLKNLLPLSTLFN